MSFTNASIKQAVQKLEQIEKDTNDYLDSHMEDLFNKYVIPEMKAVATAMNLPKEFAEGIEFRKTGYCTGQVINTWGTPKKPLALWFEEGTITHWIQGNPILSWISKGSDSGNNAGAIYFKNFANEPGMRMFSRGHYVKGLPKTEAMQYGLSRGLQRLKQALPKEAEGDLKN